MGRPADKLLKASRVGFLTHRWKPFASFTELLARQDTHRGVKTLAVETPGGLVLVALRAADELDYGKLATLLGVDRGLITLAASSRTQETLGVAPGFETILTDADVTCVVDERVPLLGRVIVSGGVTDRLYELAPYDLVAVSGATVADVVEEPPRR